MNTKLTRADLAGIAGFTPKVIRAFEQQAQAITDSSAATTAAVAATEGIGNATAILLSPDTSYPNARTLAIGDGFTLQDSGAGGNLTLRLKYPIKTNGGYRITLNLRGDTNLTVPTDGVLATATPPGPYANDAAASAAGVNVGEMYARSADGVVVVRLA